MLCKNFALFHYTIRYSQIFSSVALTRVQPQITISIGCTLCALYEDPWGYGQQKNCLVTEFMDVITSMKTS